MEIFNSNIEEKFRMENDFLRGRWQSQLGFGAEGNRPVQFISSLREENLKRTSFLQ